jgi:pyridoxal phosphate enzyme (YggS family)
MSPHSPSNHASNPAGQLAKGLIATQKRIETAALRHGRDPASVHLVAISKQHPAEIVRQAAALGQLRFGESYPQEAVPKIESLADLHLEWHFVGQIQSNKTRTIAEHFAWVHTVDRLKIAERLSDQRRIDAPPLNVCIQVKLADEAGKGGVPLSDALQLGRSIAAMPRLQLRGLMCIPPPTESFDRQLAFFRATADLQANLQSHGLAIDTLSMGMTADLEAAVAAGATIVRVGTAIFGERNKVTSEQ